MTVRPAGRRVVAVIVVAVLAASAAAASAAAVTAPQDDPAVSLQVGHDDPTVPGADGDSLTVGMTQVADCEASPRQVERGEEVILDASATQGADYVEFDVDGDGDYDLEDAEDFVETVAYRVAGVYEPTVRAVGAGNETASCGEVVVGDLSPAANISYEPSDPVTGQPITFDGTNSSDPDGNVTSYEWYIDGQLVNEAAVFEYTTDDAGTYRVTLVVTDDDGNTDEATTNVTVEPNEPPTASLSASPEPAAVGQTITFDASDSTDPDGEIVAYRWDLDGDGTYDRTTESSTIEHAFDARGTYTVVVEVVDDAGATDTAERRLDVGPRTGGPVARCTVDPAEVEPGEPVVIDARETTDASFLRVDVDGDGTYDRTVEGEFVIRVRYEEPGTYAPRVQAVTDLEGADELTDTATCGEVVVAVNEPPIAALETSPSGPAPGQDVTLDASDSTDPDGEIVEYRWDLDGDGEFDRTTETPTIEHAYDEAGTYTVVVEVVDDDGATDTAEGRIDVSPANEPPTAAFTDDPSTPVPNETVTFDASGSSDPDGEVVEYRWDFDGDGEFDRTTASPTVEHAFEAPGNASVVLQVVDDDGATDTTERELRVERAPTVPLEELLVPLLLGGVTAAGVAWWRSRRRPDGDKPRRRHYPKPKPSLLPDDVEYYAAGTFEVPAAGTSAVTVTDVGFEPDLVLLTATDASRIDAFPPRSESWSSGVAMRTPEGIEQHVTVVADDALSTDQATVATTDGDAIAAVRHSEGPPAHVRGRVVATTADGFEVVVSGVQDASDAGRIGVHYRAFNFPYEVEVETGHFLTPTEPGVQTVELGVDADHVALTASSAVGGLDRRWTTDRSVGLSAGMAVGRDEPVQTVRNGTAWPGREAETVAFGATDRALHHAYCDGNRIAGRTTAAVIGLGEHLALRYDRLYSGPEKIGWTEPHVVSYVALNSGGVLRPAIGAFRVPAPDETVAVEVGFEPGMVEFSTCGAESLGEHGHGAAAAGPFARSTGTAVVDDGELRQYVVQGTGAATPPPGPTVAGAVDPGTLPDAAAAETSPAGSDGAVTDGGGPDAMADAGEQAVDAATTVSAGDRDEIASDGRDDEVNATPDGRVATVLSLDADGVISGRDDLRIEAFTDRGFRLSVESVSTDVRDPDAETRPYVFYRAWPAAGEDAGVKGPTTGNSQAQTADGDHESEDGDAA